MIRDVIDQAERIAELLDRRRFLEVRTLLQSYQPHDLGELVVHLPEELQAVAFRLLPRHLAAPAFEYLPLEEQEGLLKALGDRRLSVILDEMAPDDRTQLLEELPGKVTKRLLNLLSPDERAIATQLLGYPPESIGRLMTPDYVAAKPQWTIEQTLSHVRVFGRDSETLNVVYVTGPGGKLVADIRMREVLLASPDTLIRDLIHPGVQALSAMSDQEEAVLAFRRSDRSALPVVDTQGVLVGIITVDDVLDVAEAEATEDIHKFVASESLEQPYLSVRLGTMIRKRSVWLILLFFGQMLTANAMGRFEAELAQALVLALFVPLIISSGGNSGSQAAALIIRALTLGEVHIRNWFGVLSREFATGAAIGLILGGLGFLRVAVVQAMNGSYGEHWMLVGLTIGVSLIGVVLWGTVMGAILPLALQRLGLDPAASSTPAVATLVDVTGIMIYFSIAATVLRGTLL